MLSFSSSHYSEIHRFLQDSFNRTEHGEELSEQSLRFLLQIHQFARHKQFPQLLELNELIKMEFHANPEKFEPKKKTGIKSGISNKSETFKQSDISKKSETQADSLGFSVGMPVPVSSSPTSGSTNRDMGGMSPPASPQPVSAVFGRNLGTTDSPEEVLTGTPGFSSEEILTNEETSFLNGDNFSEKDFVHSIDSMSLREQSSDWEIPDDGEISVDQLNSIEMMSATILLRLRERYIGE